tara:strand:- start:8423 stop:8632 length:210 start_codon:yes stop_codon:yes gene_type:complete
MEKLFKPTLIKDYGPHKEGEKYGWIDMEGYTNLFNGGYIEDENGLIETKKAKKAKKTEEIQEENNSNNE